MQNSLFKPPPPSIEEAVKLLRENDYIVIKLSDLEETSVKNTKDLISMFYSMLTFYNPDRKIHYNKTSKRELLLAKKMVESRKSTGITMARALKECAAIVKCVAKHEREFNLEAPIHSFDIFGQDTMKWVVDRAIDILNGECRNVENQEYIAMMDTLYIHQEKEALAKIDKKVKSLKKKLEELDGKEKD